jgi:hypothetical protein
MHFVGETIPAMNNALLPPPCLGFCPTVAQSAYNYLFIFPILELK